MKYRFRMLTALTAAAVLSCNLPAFPINAVDSPYVESTETILNPGMGYTSTVWYRCKPGDTPVLNPTGSLVLMFIDVGAFSVGENGTADYPFDNAFFAGLRGTFENCRKNGCTIALRLRYDDNGTENPEPATFEMVQSHIRQIGDSAILEEYKDILMFVESGTVGCYGEQWGGKYCTVEQKAALLDLWLDIVPAPIPVTVRTPDIFAAWAGIKRSELADWTSDPDSRAARVGLYDDGYMGSDSDLGTYADRETETAWLGRQTRTSCFGGEFSGNLEFAQKYTTYLPENAIPEMYQTHLTYINSNIFGLYGDYTFGEQYDVQGADNSAYYGQTVHKFIRDHLGYRFVLRRADVTAEAMQGGEISAAFAVENTGFANPVMKQKCEILLEKDGCYYRAPVDVEPQHWYSCTVSEEHLKLQLPDGIEPGEWRVFLKLSVGNQTVGQFRSRSVQFANDGIYEPSLGANYLGTVQIAEGGQSGTAKAFGQIGAAESGDGILYTVNGQQITDGVPSNRSETAEQILRAESDNARLYITNDETNLYVRAAFDGKADAPVFNLEFTNPDVPEGEEKRYWIYYASNGYIYFNHGEPVGCLQKHSEGFVEFQIPLGDVMHLQLGTKLSGVRFFLQDSANDWALISDVRASEYTLTGDFPVYTAKQAMVLRAGDTLTLTAEVGLESGSWQWMKDGKPIDGAAAERYVIQDASAADAGLYAVQITSPAGTVKTVEVCELTVQTADQRGDVNRDGRVTVADAVMLARIVAEDKTVSVGEQGLINAELDGTAGLSAADVTLLLKYLAKIVENL